MELINIQVITLLTAIIAIVSNFLSLNEKIAKMGITNVLKALCYYILPILFIKQIIVITYTSQLALSIIFLIISLTVFILIKRYKISFYNNDERYIIYFVLLSSMFFLFQQIFPGFGISNYSNLMMEYINDLTPKMRFIEMVKYITDNLACTLYILSDTITIILFVIVEIKELFYYSEYIINGSNHDITIDLDVDIDLKLFSINTILLLLISTGFMKCIINYVCTTIIF